MLDRRSLVAGGMTACVLGCTGLLPFERIVPKVKDACAAEAGSLESAHNAYREVIQQYRSLYGDPVAESARQGAWTFSVTAPRGLCFARVLNLSGTGVGELVLVWREETDPPQASYTLGVWGFDGSSVVQLVQQALEFSSNLDEMWMPDQSFSVASDASRDYIALGSIQYIAPGDYVGTRYYGVVDGVYALVHDYGSDGFGIDAEWYIDGTPVDIETYTNDPWRVGLEVVEYPLCWKGPAPYPLAIETPYPTLAELSEGQPFMTDDGLEIRMEGLGYRVAAPYYSVWLPRTRYPQGFTCRYDGRLGNMTEEAPNPLGYRLNVGAPQQRAGDIYEFMLMAFSTEEAAMGLQGDYTSQVVCPIDGGPSLGLTLAVYNGLNPDAPDWPATVLASVAPYVAGVGYANGDMGSMVHGVDEKDPLYTYLADLYGRLGTYNDRVAACAVSFNENYATCDQEFCAAQLEELAALSVEVMRDKESLNASGACESSSFGSYATMMGELLDDLYERLRPINEAWNIRMTLGVEEVSTYESEILEPFMRTNDENGHNIYKSHFDNQFPIAWPF